MRRSVGTFPLTLLLFCEMPVIAQSSKYQAISDLLRPANYAQLTSYGTDYHPGGLVTHCDGTWKYQGLPTGAAYPTPKHQPRVFAAVKGQNKTSAGGLASFLSSVFKLNFSGSNATSITLTQLSTDDTYITDAHEIFKDTQVVQQVQEYINSDSCAAVYEVMSVLTTSHFEIETGSAIGGGVEVNGGDIPSCQIPGSQKTPAPSKQGGGIASATKPVNSTKAGTVIAALLNPTAPGKGSGSSPAGGSQQGTSKGGAGKGGALGPAYGIYGCKSSDVSITLSSDVPVAIAIQSNRVNLPTNSSGPMVKPVVGPNPSLDVTKKGVNVESIFGSPH